MVGALLFIAAARIGPRAALGNMKDLGQTAALIVLYQLVLPLGALALVLGFGLSAAPLAIAAVLMLAAPSISGSPNFTALMGHDPAPPMRLLILGTAIFPVTVLPVLWLMPGLGETRDVLIAAGRLLAVIAGAVGLGFAFRRMILPQPDEPQIRKLDGAGAILLGVLVIGLMSALGPALRTAPQHVLWWLLAVCILNFGFQIAAFLILGRPGVSIVAGNRNIALFLVALPEEVTRPLLVFIGCYQIPMYLTPIVMAPLYRRKT